MSNKIHPKKQYVFSTVNKKMSIVDFHMQNVSESSSFQKINV